MPIYVQQIKLCGFLFSQVRTDQIEEFKEVTAGVDMLFSIPSTSLQHQGTYQCEIYSDHRSIVRLYFHITGKQESLI